MKRFLFLAGVLVLGASASLARADALDADLVQDAGHGDADALHEVFKHSMVEAPGSGAYGHQLRDILLAVGNGRFTAALKAEPAPVRQRVMFFLNAAMASH